MRKIFFLYFRIVIIFFIFLSCIGKSKNNLNDEFLLWFILSGDSDNVDPSVSFQSYPVELEANIPQAISISTKGDIRFNYSADVEESSASRKQGIKYQTQDTNRIVTIKIIDPDNGKVVGGIVSQTGLDSYKLSHTPTEDKIYILSICSNSDVTLIPTLQGVDKKPKPPTTLSEVYTTVTDNSTQEDILVDCYIQNKLNDDNPSSVLAYCMIASVSANNKPTYLSSANVQFSIGSYTVTLPYSYNNSKDLSACVPTSDRNSISTSYVYVDCLSSSSIQNGAKVTLKVQDSSKELDKTFELYIPNTITNVKINTGDDYYTSLNVSALSNNRNFLISKAKNISFKWDLPENPPVMIGLESVRVLDSSTTTNSMVFSSEYLEEEIISDFISNLETGVNQSGPGTNSILLSPKLMQNSISCPELYNGLVEINGAKTPIYSGLTLTSLNSTDISKGGDVNNYALSSYDYGTGTKQNIVLITE